jgi:hypothetical protein
MIKTGQLQEISRLIESLGDIKSETFIIEGGLKLFNTDTEGKRELIGFIVHENDEWAYSPPVIASSTQQITSSQIITNGQPRAVQSSPTGVPSFAERMGTPQH